MTAPEYRVRVMTITRALGLVDEEDEFQELSKDDNEQLRRLLKA
jgi:hypothetical protein